MGISPLKRWTSLGACSLILVAAAAACGADPETGAVSVVDSAGVALVMNTGTGIWRSGEGWTVEEVRSLGAAEGDPDYEFGMIGGLDVDPDGRILVADLQARAIRVYAPDGTFERSIGSAGSGPGELGLAIAGPFLVEREVWVPDLENQRVTRFSPEGELQGSFRLDFTVGIPIRWDELPGDLLLAQLRATSRTEPTAAPSGDPVVSLAADGSVQDTILVLPPGESFQMSGGQVQVRLFASEPIWDADDDGRIVSGRSDEYRIEVRDREGELRRVVSRPFERRPVTARDQEVILAAVKDAARQQGVPEEAIETVFAGVAFADFYPNFASLLAGPDGTIWVQAIRTGTDIAADGADFDVQDLGSSEWDVFDGDGRYLGVVSFGVRFQPLRVIGDRFYGVARDELGVQAVSVYQLVR